MYGAGHNAARQILGFSILEICGQRKGEFKVWICQCCIYISIIHGATTRKPVMVSFFVAGHPVR